MRRRMEVAIPLRSLLRSLLVILILIGAGIASADTVTYTFVGAEGTSGTSWTLVDPTGYLSVPTGNVIGLVQTATPPSCRPDDWPRRLWPTDEHQRG